MGRSRKDQKPILLSGRYFSVPIGEENLTINHIFITYAVDLSAINVAHAGLKRRLGGRTDETLLSLPGSKSNQR